MVATDLMLAETLLNVDRMWEATFVKRLGDHHRFLSVLCEGVSVTDVVKWTGCEVETFEPRYRGAAITGRSIWVKDKPLID